MSPRKLMWHLKSQLDQNPIMIYHKSIGDFKKATLILGRHGDDMLYYSYNNVTLSRLIYPSKESKCLCSKWSLLSPMFGYN